MLPALSLSSHFGASLTNLANQTKQTKYLNYQRVRRWNNPVGFAPVPAMRRINKTYVRNAHVVDMDQVYIRIWHLTKRRRFRCHSGLAGTLLGIPRFNWRQSTRMAQGAGGVAGQMTAAEIAEVMNSPAVANYPVSAGSVDALRMRINELLWMLPEFLCQLGSATTQYSFL